MATEIERKFLVLNDSYQKEAYRSISIIQGYLATAPGCTVRVRVAGDQGFITIKGAPLAGSIARYEWEKEIPLHEARELLSLCANRIIEKTRHKIEAGRFVFEVDEFHGANQGLVVAEIELTSETDEFEKPSWLGQEVTGDARYYNSMLTKMPFLKWENE
jgi:adenylate cyclase